MASKALNSAVMALALAATAAHAGPIEDKFKAFIDGLKAKGTQILGNVTGPIGAKEITKPVLERRTDKLPLGKDQYVLFVADGCRSCPALAAKLEKETRGSVEVLNITTSQTAKEAFVLSKAKGVPAMLVGTQVMSGYSDKLYKQAKVQAINDAVQNQRNEGGGA